MEKLPLSSEELESLADSMSCQKTSPQSSVAISDDSGWPVQVSALGEVYNNLQMAVMDNFPSVWPLLHAYLSAIASLCFSDFPLPVTLIASGPSGSGKTEPLMWIVREAQDFVERCDVFTSASFVSHASNVKKTDLEKNDLLPKLKDRVLCTKELAPLFAGREDELRVSFAKLTTILDGEGLVTASGSHGTRGYEKEIAFVWLGATTPPTKQVFATMAALGTRLFFFSTDSKRPTAVDYAELITGKRKQSGNRTHCRDAVRNFLNILFTQNPKRSMSHEFIVIPDDIGLRLGVLCDALTNLRGAVSIGEGNLPDDDRHGSPAMEHGWRAAQILAVLAKGSALIRGNVIVNEHDFEFVRHVCLSSMPEYRRLCFEAILTLGGMGTAQQVATHSGMAKKTAHHYLKELKVLGVIDGDLSEEPFRFTLNDKFIELLSTPTKSVTATGLDQKTSVEGVRVQNVKNYSVTENEGVKCHLDESPQVFPDLPEGF